MVTYIWVNIGSVNGLLSDGTKSLPDPKLTNHQGHSVALTREKIHNITMTSQWTRWRLKSPASPLFTQLFIRAQIKENIKAPGHWPLCVEFTGNRWIPRTNGQLRGKCFHLMMSSCKVFMNSTHLPHSATYRHQWTESSLVQVMAYDLFCDKPLTEPMLTYSRNPL